jgi:hypothetical protein
MNPTENAAAAPQLSIELTEDIAEGIYSNLVMIAHSPEEFILDFIRVMPGVPKARVKSRIIVTPPHVKRLLAALRDNISRYEAQYGPIEEPEGRGGPQFTFQPPSGEA